MNDTTDMGTASSLPLNVEVPGYRLRHLAGSDSIGSWFSAEQTSLGRRVTLKVLKPNFEAHEAARREFLAEMDRLAELDHPGLPRVLDTRREGVLFLVVERVGPPLLASQLTGKPLVTGQALALMAAVAQALRYLDGKGLAHKNVSPETIALREGGGCRLLTFRNILTAAEQTALRGRLAQDVAYIAPEQLAGESPIGSRTPSYQVAALLFHLLAGRPAYGTGTPQEIARAHLAGPFPSLKRFQPFAPKGLLDLVAACTAIDPDARPSLDELVAALEALGAGKDPGLTPPEGAGGGIVAPVSRRKRRRR